MKCRDALETIMKEAGLTQGQLAKMVGMKNQSNVSEALKRDMKISVVASFAEAMGYEVVIQRKKPGPRSKDQYVVSGGEEK